MSLVDDDDVGLKRQRPHLEIDQFEWTQHNQNWREDLKLITDGLGLKHLRYALPWSYLEPQRGRFDWSAADERIDACRELGIELPEVRS